MIYRKRSNRVVMLGDKGEKLYKAENVCPNKRHQLDGHDRETSDERHDGPILLSDREFDT